MVTKARFGPLDAMRGIGALAVVLCHTWPLTSSTCRDPSCNVPFGFLAVDMFFVLSGFVIAYSYDPRFERGMTLREFAVARVVRLYPIFFLCASLGSLPMLWAALHGQASRGVFLLAFGTNILMLPAPASPTYPDPFPLVSPAWLLFFELFVANLSYALLWKHLTTRVLATIVGASLALLVGVAVVNGSIDGGSLWRTFPIGFPRVLFGFYTGVLVFRLRRWREAPSVPSLPLLALVALTFWPRLSGWSATLYELGCVALVYPVLIYLGASARERAPRIGAALGDLSYALYLVHIPILLPILAFGPRFALVEGWRPALAFVATAIAAAVLIARVYDPPARRALGGALARVAR